LKLSASTGTGGGARTNWRLGLRSELIPEHLQLNASIGSLFEYWSGIRIAIVGLAFLTPAFMR